MCSMCCFKIWKKIQLMKIHIILKKNLKETDILFQTNKYKLHVFEMKEKTFWL